MCWKCDHPGSTIEEYFDQLRETIRTSGWAVQFVESDRTPYAYTIGLHDWDVPELLVTGVSAQRAVRLLNSVATTISCAAIRLRRVSSSRSPWDQSSRSWKWPIPTRT